MGISTLILLIIGLIIFNYCVGLLADSIIGDDKIYELYGGKSIPIILLLGTTITSIIGSIIMLIIEIKK
jgi:hypothetical protein